MSLDSTELSSKKTIGDWKDIRGTLAAANADIWKDVLRDFYYDRLKTRYLDPINAVKKMRRFKGEGFAIVAIQCSLIEFLESCLLGKNYKHRNPAPPHEYNDSRGVFTSFLTKHRPFKRRFDDALANDFYGSVRCGVLHEARTKGTWIIKAKSKLSLIVNPKRPILYRDDFQEAIIEFIENYRRDVPKDFGLRDAFIRKFDHLCT